VALPVRLGHGALVRRLRHHRKAYEYVCANLLPLLPGTPILVYQMGRGGSSSLRNALLRSEEPQTRLVFHFHDFFPLRKLDVETLAIEDAQRPAMRAAIRHANDVYARFPLRQKACWLARETLYAQRIFRNVIRGRRPAKVITLVREPIATNISMFFQVLRRYTDAPYEELRLTTPELIELFKSAYNCSRPLTWFDVELKPALGIDPYRHPFSPERGHQIIRAPKLEVLILRAELSDPVKEQAVAEFLGIDGLELGRSNASSKKAYAQQYREFTDAITFGPEFVDAMYESRYARHFYSEDERQRLRSRWSNR
jgi:hypothetical protein